MLPQIVEVVRKSVRRLRASKGLPQIEAIPSVGPATLASKVVYTDYPIYSGEAISGYYFDNDNRTPIWVGLNHPFNREKTLDGAVVSDCMFRYRRNWASRPYRVKNLVFSRCGFLGTDPEHDIYANLAGGGIGVSLGVYRSVHIDTAGQVIQTVCRESDWYGQTPPEDLEHTAPIVVDKLIAVNPGHSVNRPSNRAGFSLSFFESDSDLTLTDILIDKSMQERSSGCLYAESKRRVTVSNFNTLVRNAWQPVVKMREIDSLLFIRSHFATLVGNLNLEFEGCSPRFVDCTGSAIVKVNGRQLGTVQELSDTAQP